MPSKEEGLCRSPPAHQVGYTDTVLRHEDTKTGDTCKPAPFCPLTLRQRLPPYVRHSHLLIRWLTRSCRRGKKGTYLYTQVSPRKNVIDSKIESKRRNLYPILTVEFSEDSK
jgi:hypothetical protein